jgi:hypothetical protein
MEGEVVLACDLCKKEIQPGEKVIYGQQEHRIPTLGGADPQVVKGLRAAFHPGCFPAASALGYVRIAEAQSEA